MAFQPDQVLDKAARLLVPAAAHLRAEDDELLGPASFETRSVARLRRSATFSAASSTTAAHGCGCPVRVRGDTNVASQHKASPWRVAPYTTRSSQRLSSAPTPGAVLWASHCCGTTWPSSPSPLSRRGPTPVPPA